jgi:hypothetical protein
MRNIRNIYFVYRDAGADLDYKIMDNVKETDKKKLYALEDQGYKVIKILANEQGEMII